MTTLAPPCPGAQIAKLDGREFWSTGGKVIRFIEAFCVYSNGRWTGQRFVLLPWQKKLLYELFEINPNTGRRRFRRALIGLPRKAGKALALDTPVPTPTGWATMGALAVGDEVFDERGAVCRVTATSEVFSDHDCYRLWFSNGEQVIADAGHRWVTTTRVDRPGVRTTARTDQTRARTTREIAETLRYGTRGDLNHSLAMPAPIAPPDADLPVDPWVLGVWLGDGNSRCARLTVGAEDEHEMLAGVRAAGHAVSTTEERTPGVLTVGIGVTGRGSDGSLQVALRRLGLLANKRIPPAYLRGSVAQRLALLQGLMDTDGYADARGSCEFVTTKPLLADGVAELLASLGIKYTRRVKQPRINGNPAGKMATILAFNIPAEEMPVFRLKRKAARQRHLPPTGAAPRSRSVQIVACDPVPSVPVRCIAVDSPTHQFLVGRTMLPTHNTELAAAIGLYLMLADGEMSAQIYCAAASEDQADMVFEGAKRMCEMKGSPLSSLVDVQQSRLTSKADPYSFIQRLSSKGRTKHGLNIHGVILDELHAWGAGEGEELWAALNTGSAARSQPMQIAITTAGVDLEESRCGQMYQLGRAIERGEQDGAGFFFRWWQAPDGMDHRDPDYPRLASPSYGVTVDEGFYRDELASVPEAVFRRLYGNEWVDFGEKPWVTREEIRACRLPAFPMVAGAATWVGIDLSETRDSTAVAWVQWNGDSDRPCAAMHAEMPDAPCLYLHCKTWEQPRLPDGRRDSEWEVPQAEVKAFLRSLNSEFEVATNVFDPWHSKLMRQDLENEGIVCEEIPQTGIRRAGASASLYDLIVQRRLHYCDDTFERHVMNATIRETGGDGGYYLAKRRRGKVMDAAMAAVNAVYGSGHVEGEPASVYETRGLTVL